MSVPAISDVGGVAGLGDLALNEELLSAFKVEGAEFKDLLAQLLEKIKFVCPHCGVESGLLKENETPAAAEPANAGGAQSAAVQGMQSSGMRGGVSGAAANPYVTSGRLGNSMPLASSSAFSNTMAAPGAGGLPGNIEWPRGQDVSQWKQTVQIDVTRLGNGKITWAETGDRGTWPVKDGLNANMWIIREVAPGKYKAETWEWLRPGQTTKLLENIEAMGAPRSGERVGFMLAGMTRNPRMQNVQARSNIDWVTWP